jgi:hypothetical protein
MVEEVMRVLKANLKNDNLEAVKIILTRGFQMGDEEPVKAGNGSLTIVMPGAVAPPKEVSNVVEE